MSIKHIRIDERLVHGQVASVWVNTVGATRIMVINDEANQDDFTKKMLRMATPSAIALSVLTKQKAIDNIKKGQYDNDKVMVVLKCVEDANTLFSMGFDAFNVVNIGNVSKKDADAISPATGVYLNKVDVDAVEGLKAQNVEVTLQMTPKDSLIKL